MIRLVSPKYVETFDNNPKISGNLLVGLSWDPLPGRFDVNGVGVLLPPAFRWRKACVEVASQDGRYFAQNLYQFPNEQGAEVFETKTSPDYLIPLQRYAATEMAVSVRLVDDCNSAERGVLIPAMFSEKKGNGPVAAPPRQMLVAYLNADAQRLKVSLRKKGGTDVVIGICHTEANAVRVAFSSSCEFRMPAPADYVLVVQLQERFDSHESDFNVSLRQ